MGVIPGTELAVTTEQSQCSTKTKMKQTRLSLFLDKKNYLSILITYEEHLLKKQTNKQGVGFFPQVLHEYTLQVHDSSSL